MVGRARFELATYGLRVRLTRISMRRKPKIRNEFFVGRPAPETEPIPNRVSIAAGSSHWNSNGIIELREVGTDLAPNDANFGAGRWPSLSR